MLTYTVQPDDSIFSISRRFGIPPNRLAADNGLTSPELIIPGQSLYINPASIRAENSPVSPQTPQSSKRSILVNGYAYPTITANTLNCVLPFLTFICPFSYSMTPQAELVPPNDEDLIFRSQRSAVMPLMTVTNLFEEGFSTELMSGILASGELTERLISNIISAAANRRYYGVNMDIEYIAPADRERYNDFLRRLADRLHERGYIITSALAPKTSANQRGILYEAHDYPVQGEIVDYIFLMTYECDPK